MKTIPNMALAVAPVLGLYVFVTSTFYPLDFLSVFDAKRMLQLGVFAALLALAVFYPPLRKATVLQLQRVPKPAGYAILVFFIIGLASSLQLSHPAYALVDVSMLYVMLILVFVTAASRNLAGTSFDKWAVLLLAATGFAVAFQEFVGYVSGWVLGIEFKYDTALVHFAHPRFYNQLQTWSIPVLAALPLLFPNRRWIKSLCILLLGLQWFLVFSTGARGTFVSLLTAMIFIALWLPKSRRFWLSLQLAGVLTGIVFYLGIWFLNYTLIPQTGDFYAQSVGRSMMHTSGRSMLWRFSVEDAIENPILGSGPTRYACDEDKLLPAHPHSFPFQILGEWGFVAFTLLLFLVISIGFNFLRDLKHQYEDSFGDHQEKDPGNSLLRVLLATSVIAAAIHSCLDGLLMPASQVTLVLIAGWVLGLSSNSRQVHRTFSVASIVLFAALLLATAQLVFAIREVPRFPERTGLSVEPVRLAPRFWWVGRACDYRYPNETR